MVFIKFQVTSVCFQEFTIHFDHNDDTTHCSCRAQATDLNQLQYLILNIDEDNCSRCFNVSVNNYTVYVETDGGSLSNVILVMYFPSESNPTNKITQKGFSTVGKQLLCYNAMRIIVTYLHLCVDSSSFEHLNVVIAVSVGVGKYYYVCCSLLLILLPFHAVMSMFVFILLLSTFCCCYWLHHVKSGNYIL